MYDRAVRGQLRTQTRWGTCLWCVSGLRSDAEQKLDSPLSFAPMTDGEFLSGWGVARNDYKMCVVGRRQLCGGVAAVHARQGRHA